MSETPMLPYVGDAPCYCESAYAEDEDGNCTSADLCQNCLVRNGHCVCSKEAQCWFCEERGPFELTPATVAAAAAAAAAAAEKTHEHMENVRAEWRSTREARVAKWEYDYLDLHCEDSEPSEEPVCECRECLLSPAAQKQFNEELRRKFQPVLELPLWSEAWASGNAAHMDPEAWCSKLAWKLVWNARRLS